ncbi:MAG TPA: NAD-dependent epimerase/dehydratase family protein [Planctomycetota bacterium]|jgi:nucleoside-diphosphate-sugar epimerase|nr:NAD-dependent epimerase/dehydratase family protein [Planctomycetota bacterium]
MTGGRLERVLVTGGTGFLGRPLVDALRPLAGAVAVLARRPPVAPVPGAAFLPGDCAEGDSLREPFEAVRPTAVLHLAGLASPRKAEEDPEGAFAANALGTLHALEAASSRAPGALFLLASSAHVYGSAAGALREQDPREPRTVYGRTKAAAETLASAFAARGGLEVRIVRIFNLVGPGQGAEYALGSFARQVAAIEAGRVPPILRVGALDVRRDFLDVRDAVRAILALATAEGSTGLAYNLGSGRAVAVRDLLEALLARARVRPEVEVDPARLRAGEPAEVCASIDRLSKATGFEPRIPLERSAADVLDEARRAG